MLQSQPILQTGQHCCYKVCLGLLPLSPQCTISLLFSRKKPTLMSNDYPKQGTAILVRVSCQEIWFPEQCSDLLLWCNGQGIIPKFPEIPLLWDYLRPKEHRIMDTSAEELLSARAAEEEAEANAFDDELLEALSEGVTGPASPEVPNTRCLL